MDLLRSFITQDRLKASSKRDPMLDIQLKNRRLNTDLLKV